ncbi:porin [Shewanella woodyi]|uniref:Porin Gram-negative type n=1 Tax=Shewanella woodyi (strain ATCC 51908 / MS32) TaxID=392500 RepID=B1KJ48_SHEWM|nr:porin [Shewanella woodyi]ACA87068.1 porin Gram-negative type [Shewanella woodyi ATCC 51908]
MMNRQITLLAACITCLCSPAQAIELNIYGQGHLSVDSVDDGQDSSIYVASNSSRLGFNGDHQINSDLKIIFQYETGVDLTAQGGNDGNGGAESSGQIFTKGRPSFLGIEGKFGTALAGHMPFLDQYANDYNLFADQVGDLGNLWEASGIPGRSDNVVYYKTPDFSGFDAAVTYVPEEGVDDSDYYLLKGNYVRDDLKLGVMYTSIGQGEMVDKDHTAAAVTLGYHFGRFSVGGGYQSEMDIGGSPGNDRDSFSLGGSMEVGDKGKIKAQFAVSSGEGDASDATQIAVGYDYQFDTQTTLYIAYANMDNDDNVNFSVNGKGHGDKVVPLMGNDPHAISLGIVYSFSHAVVK